MQNMDVDAIAKMIDHTLLAPEATRVDIENLCQQAVEFNFTTLLQEGIPGHPRGSF